MAELRRDPIVGRWVIVAGVEDSLGPDAYEHETHVFKQKSICPFCPGRENHTPKEVEAIRTADSKPNTPGWSARVVPNKFPALSKGGELEERETGIYDTLSGVGAHEVLIESPDHEKNLADFSVKEVEQVLRLYQKQFVKLAEDERFKYVMIFKNYGTSAGASAEHGHSQIIALPMIPKNVLEELEGSQSFRDARGRCIYCAMIEQEGKEQERVILDNEDYISFCPFVPRYPFECWILPREHRTDFGAMTEPQRFALAEILKDTLSRMKKVLFDPSYNFYLHVGPVNSETRKDYHWHIEVIPKLTRAAGFEWGTGFYVVKTCPSVVARYLREND